MGVGHSHDGAHGHGHGHDYADRVDDALADSATGIRAVKISLIALAATAIVQLVIVGFSGSVALLADTVHNLSDALTAVPLWIAFALSRRAASRRYTYGLGRAEDLAGLFVLTVIAGSAAFAAAEAVRRLIHPAPLSHLPWVAAAGVVSVIGNEFVAVYRIRIGTKIGSAALKADGVHARVDGLTSLAVVAGAAGVAAGFAAADPIVGLAIAVVIVGELAVAARDVFRRLLDGVDPALVAAAHQALAHHPGVESVHRVRMRWLGHRLLADVELDVDPDRSLSEAHRIAHDAEHALTHAVPKLAEATVHAYPAHAVKSG
jgi:cation diffusion facilitator family transporter